MYMYSILNTLYTALCETCVPQTCNVCVTRSFARIAGDVKRATCRSRNINIPLATIRPDSVYKDAN